MHTAGTFVIAALATAFTTVNPTVRAEESVIPRDMLYIGEGPSIMGLDKDNPKELASARTAYHKRNRTRAGTLMV